MCQRKKESFVWTDYATLKTKTKNLFSIRKESIIFNSHIYEMFHFGDYNFVSLTKLLREMFNEKIYEKCRRIILLKYDALLLNIIPQRCSVFL